MGEQTRKLTKEAQMFVVASHARFESNETIIENLRNQFNVDLASASITYYNPTYLAKIGKQLQPELQDHFVLHRQLFLDSINAIPGSSQSFRVAELQEMATAVKKQKNYVLAAKLYEQIARELGGMYVAKNFQNSSLNVTAKVEHKDASITDSERLTKLQEFITDLIGTAKEGT